MGRQMSSPVARIKALADQGAARTAAQAAAKDAQREKLRQACPQVAEWVDWTRAAFGEAVKVAYMAENGITKGKKLQKGALAWPRTQIQLKELAKHRKGLSR